MKKKATIKDVAELAGVSKSTVSYVLSGKRPISPEVTRRVHDAMEQLQYKPSVLAKNLAERQTKTIGLYGPSTDSIKEDLFFNLILSGILDFTTKNDYKLMLYPEKRDKQNKSFWELDHSQPIDGALIMNPDLNAHYLDLIKKEDVPFVLIGSPSGHSDIFFVDNDNIAATYKATNFLMEKGHTRILFINGPAHYVASAEREKGYRMACNEHGIPIDNHHIFYADFTENQGYRICLNALENRYPFTAVLTANDILAVGVLKALKEKKIKTPEHIAVMGMGNTLISQIHSPSITTVDMHAYELGYNAANLLLNVIHKNKISHCSIIVSSTLVPRETT